MINLSPFVLLDLYRFRHFLRLLVLSGLTHPSIILLILFVEGKLRQDRFVQPLHRLLVRLLHLVSLRLLNWGF